MPHTAMTVGTVYHSLWLSEGWKLHMYFGQIPASGVELLPSLFSPKNNSTWKRAKSNFSAMISQVL